MPFHLFDLANIRHHVYKKRNLAMVVVLGFLKDGAAPRATLAATLRDSN